MKTEGYERPAFEEQKRAHENSIFKNIFKRQVRGEIWGKKKKKPRKHTIKIKKIKNKRKSIRKLETLSRRSQK